MVNVLGAQCPRCLLNLGSTLGLAGETAVSDALLDPFQVRTFGDYELLEEIARGGMGVVYRARQISLGREVAIKMILAGELAGKASLQLFQREAHAAANLHHPNIIPVFEIGEHETQHYFSMRFVPGGKTIAHWASEQSRDPRVIATAAAQVARAVAHAHAHGVLHRDLKPSNILWDTDSGPQVTDFGLAKLQGTPDSTITLGAKALGSPSYMAPEQAEGRLSEITTSTDVYGLGAVLYELLAGRPPFAGSSPIETMRRAVEREPDPLPRVPRDLQTVCLKCLAKQPEHRYSSAAALAEDLERFARGEPVAAVPLTAVQSAWRWARRRPGVALLIVGCMLSLAAGVGGIAWQWHKAERARQGESLALHRVTETVVDLYTRSGINAAGADDPTRASLWFAKAAAFAPDPARQAEELGRQMAWRMGTYTCVRAFPSGIGVVEDLRWNAAQTAIAARVRQGRRSAVWEIAAEKRWQPAEWESMESATWAHRASWIAYASGGQVLVADYPSAREIGRVNAGGAVTCLAVYPDDQWIAIGGPEPFLWNLASGERKALPPDLGPLTGLEFSRNGRDLLLTSSTGRAVCAVSAPGSFRAPPVEAHRLRAVGFLGDGDAFVTTTRKGPLLVIETATGQMLESYAIPSALNEPVCAVSPDGRFIARHSSPLILRSAGLTNFPVHKNRFEAAHFSPDGEWLLTGSYDNAVRLWPMTPKGAGNGLPVGWHQEGVTAVSFSPDQRFIAVAQWGGALIRIWRPPDSIPFRRIETSANTGVRLSSDGSLFVLNGWSIEGPGLKRTRVYRATDGEPVGPELKPGGVIVDAQLAPDGSWLALACLTERERRGHPGAGVLQIWDFRNGRILGDSVPLPAEPRGLAIHPSGQWIGLYDAQSQLAEVNVATRELRMLEAQRVTSDPRPFGRCAYSPDGSLLVGWGLQLPPLIWDRRAEQRRRPDGKPTLVQDVTFRENVMATLPLQSRIDFLSVPGLEPAAPSIQDNDWLFVGRFSPDGRQFLSAGRGRLARLWDWRNQKLQCPAMSHDDEVFAAAFIPGTDCVTTGSIDQQIRFWNRNTGLPARPPLSQGCKVMQLTATPDGRTLIRGNYFSDHVRLYRVADLFPPATLAPDDALLLAEIDAAAEVHQGGVEPLGAAGWLAKWKEFRVKHPAWHRW